MKEEVTDRKWGGRREGAGRKSTGHGKYYGFNSTVEVESVLEKIAKGKTAFINEAIVFYARHKGLL